MPDKTTTVHECSRDARFAALETRVREIMQQLVALRGDCADNALRLNDGMARIGGLERQMEAQAGSKRKGRR